MLLLLLLSRFSRVRLCDPRDGGPSGSPVPGILQARTLEWVAIAFSPISCYQQEFWIRSPLQNLQFSSSIGLKQRASLSPLLDRETGDRASNLAFARVEELLLLLPSRFSHVRLCDPIDGSPPGSPVPGILQARTLEWVAIAFSSPPPYC